MFFFTFFFNLRPFTNTIAMKHILSVLLTATLFVATASTAAAQELLSDLYNSSASIMCDPVPYASKEIGTAIYSPAGTAFLREGFHISLSSNVYSIWRAETTSPMGKDRHKDETNIKSLVLQWAYSFGRLTLTGAYTRTINGIEIINRARDSKYEDYENQFYDIYGSHLIGNINNLILADPTIANAVTNIRPDDNLTYNIRDVYSFPRNKNTHLGLSYKLNNNFALYAGAKFVFFDNDYHCTIETKMRRASTGEEFALREYYAEAMNACKESGNEHILNEIERELESFKKLDENNNYTSRVVDGSGIVPSLGLHYTQSTIDAGLRYDFRSKYKYSFDDNDYSCYLPAMLSGGVRWQMRERLSLAVGGALQFNSSNIYGDEQGDCESGTNGTISASVTYSPLDYIHLSLGRSYEHSIFYNNSDFDPDADLLGMDRSRTNFGISFFEQTGTTTSLKFNLGFCYTTFKNRETINNDGVFTSYKIKPRFDIAVGCDISF